MIRLRNFGVFMREKSPSFLLAQATFRAKPFPV